MNGETGVSEEHDSTTKWVPAVLISVVAGTLVLLVGYLTGLNGVRSTSGGAPTTTASVDGSGEGAAGPVDVTEAGGEPPTTSTTASTTSPTAPAPSTSPATEAPATSAPPTDPPQTSLGPSGPVYLSEMDPLERDHLPKAGSRTVRGTVYSRSRVMTLCQAQGHSPREETYLVPAASSWFDVTIGLGDDTPPDERAQVEVLVDGSVVFSELLAPGDVFPLHEAVAGAYQLTITAVHVEPSGGVCSVYPTYDVVFGDARLGA